MVRKRFRIYYSEAFLALSSGSSFRRTLFTIVCLITLIGSSFRPMPGPSFALGSIDSLDAQTVLMGEEEERNSERLFYSVYQVKKGDTISGIAIDFNVTVDTIFSANQIHSAKSIQPGQFLKIPNQSGIIYQAKEGETVDEIAEKYNISADRLVEANGLLSKKIAYSAKLFLPDARLPNAVVREISGDLFAWPVRGIITSWYSWRRDPFTGRNSFHSGIDIGVPMRTPVHASMEGTVEDTGYSPIMGKFVLMRHSGGWKTLYAHMDSVSVGSGQYIQRGGRLGLSGNTGYSTGPHVHFTVYKNGKTVNPANVLK
jgi:murein DD-endopeptidase MepM/ murein hydrolase activator NlpD